MKTSPEDSGLMLGESVKTIAAQHHTKNKGDLGVAKAHCDLIEKGYIVLIPSTEHAPFDLVAYDGMRFVRHTSQI
ncbi:MAG TPA: group I intron-associated PD-(D/E)XK endonuclease [Blastocatellia bacterium]|nr:group I intron-associated PD-(D/E)XK endonuclease [Blastocatellia bacterium]